ncbi:endonuclease/exonuclease/phosphatase family protein [Hwangdonia seohaensis]|uniref:Endonuclease/exonuclease/phosphatase family protein n=1 Tax=Hwangdonia seohaensis TaxID=1240727 RepID=A0ABW3RE18_9FLAO|nr:endonuclease/exonuclease/phosphatase family protein [Hwangdonia seohaensis]
MSRYILLLFTVLVCSSCHNTQNEKKEKEDTTPKPTALKVMTFNIWQEGTMVANGLDKIRDIILSTDPDIVSFTEVRNYNDEDWTAKILKKLKDKGVDYFGKFAGGDVSLISKYPITASKVVYNGEGSVVKYDIKLNSGTIVVAAAHLDYTGYACYLPRGYYGGTPNWNLIKDENGNKSPVTNVDEILAYNKKSTRDEQIAAFLNSVKSETNPVILMGDFNEPSHLDWTEKAANRFDHNGVVINWPSTYTLFLKGFIDAYRNFHPNELTHPGITWPSLVHGKDSTSWTPLSDERDRIDFIFYKGHNIKTTSAAMVGPKASYAYNELVSTYTSEENFVADTLEWPSDHKAVMVTLMFE